MVLKMLSIMTKNMETFVRVENNTDHISQKTESVNRTDFL